MPFVLHFYTKTARTKLILGFWYHVNILKNEANLRERSQKLVEGGRVGLIRNWGVPQKT